MARYQVVIEELVRYVISVEADSAEEAADAATEEFVQAEDVSAYFSHCDAREVVTTIEVDESGLPVADGEP